MFSPIQFAFENITTDTIHLFEKKGISMSVLRLDKIHSVISGNKWFKLQHYLKEAKEQSKKTIVTSGGAYSNHIVATAAVCKLYGFASIGIIRGKKPVLLSPSLLQAREYGMQLHFISREDYGYKKLPAGLQNDDYYFINEGGYGKKGAEGASKILNYSIYDFTHCCCAVGTGTMMAGLINAVSPGQKVIGISVMKNNYDLENNVLSLTGFEKKEWQIIHDYHFGGYAKYKPELIRFMNEFYRQTNIPSDFVYTGKLFYAITNMAENNFFSAGSRLLLIHSGGLQGNRSLGEGVLMF
ncbi:MAG TPA: pyridoxal-phosphate dependent enzyme [Chitinophagaceae bacterium]|nr:pyridoxal-phosphate dependent enzyme [Chitinophagaceae bacterium]